MSTFYISVQFRAGQSSWEKNLESETQAWTAGEITVLDALGRAKVEMPVQFTESDPLYENGEEVGEEVTVQFDAEALHLVGEVVACLSQFGPVEAFIG